MGNVGGRLLGCACAVFVSVLAGCYDWRAAVVQQASFDHSCPPQNVQIIADNGDNMARAVRVDVCGNERLYRDLGGTRMYLWQDTTEMTTGGESPSEGR